MSLQTETLIRPVERHDLQRIVDFMMGFFPTLRADRQAAVCLYDWKYFDLEGRDTGMPPAFVAEDDHGIAGFLGCMPFMLRHGKTCIPAGWIADWRLAERTRGQGLGRRLIREARTLIPALGAVNGSTEAQHAYQESGFQAWDCGRAWVQVYRPLRYEWARHNLKRKPVALYRAALHLRTVQQTPPEAQGVRLGAPVPFEQASARALFRQHSENGQVRSSGYFSWLARCPAATTSFHLLLLGDQPVGYVFLRVDDDRRGLRRGRILDLFILPGADALVAAAYHVSAKYLHQVWNVLYTDLVAPSTHSQALRAIGFEARRVYRLWLHTSAFAAHQRDIWALTLVDKDNAFRGSGINP